MGGSGLREVFSDRAGPLRTDDRSRPDAVEGHWRLVYRRRATRDVRLPARPDVTATVRDDAGDLSSASAVRPAPPPTPGRAPLRAVFSGPYLWTSITIMSGTVIGSLDRDIAHTSMPPGLGGPGEPPL